MKKTFSVLFCFMLLFCSASAHAGRTDAAGGHWDKSSGTYHYHHGYPAHQHTNGICPYDYNDLTGSSSGSSSSSSIVSSVSYENEPGDYGPDAETDFETKRDAHISGFESGVEYSHDRDNPDSAYNKGYDEGYNQGRSEGESFGYDDGHQAGYDEGYDYGYDEGYAQGESYTYDSAEKEGYQRGIKETENTYLIILSIISIIAFILLISRIIIGKKYDELTRKSKALECNFQKFYSEHLKYVENKNIEHNQLKSVIADQDRKIRLLQALPPKPQKSSQPTVLSFGEWSLSVHQTEQQFTRYKRSKTDNLSILSQTDDGFVIQGTSDVYITTLNSCTCPDFNKKLHKKSPCKHIYFLAQQQGIDVQSIFTEFESKNTRS